MACVYTQLFDYQQFHQDPRNIATHYIGVPMILFAVVLMLTQPQIILGGFVFMPLYAAVILAFAFYVRLHVGLGFVMAGVLLVNSILALWISQFCNAVLTGCLLFAIGWIVQFIGHYYEGKKPAFLEDIRGLLIGPLFVICKLLFKMGLFRDVSHKISKIGLQQRY